MEEGWGRGAPICKICFFHLPTLPALLSQRRSASEGGEGRSPLVRGISTGPIKTCPEKEREGDGPLKVA